MCFWMVGIHTIVVLKEDFLMGFRDEETTHMNHFNSTAIFDGHLQQFEG